MTDRDGFRKYSGGHYQRVVKLREGQDVHNEYQKKAAMEANKKLMAEFKELQKQKSRHKSPFPFGSKYIYRGVKNINNSTNYQKNPQGDYIKDYKSYISFSRSEKVALQFATGGPANSPAVLELDIGNISKRSPVIYNGMWGFKSYNPDEQEVLLLPGRLIILRHPLRYIQYGHHKVPILRVVKFFPNKAVRNMSSGKVNPYRKK